MILARNIKKDERRFILRFLQRLRQDIEIFKINYFSAGHENLIVD